jgi:hypothetical protein
MTFIYMHSVIMCVVLPWRTYEMHPDLFLNPGMIEVLPRRTITTQPAPLVPRLGMATGRVQIG